MHQEYTQEDLENLILSPKIIVYGQKLSLKSSPEAEINQSLEIGLKIESDDDLLLELFIRRNKIKFDGFSVGLKHLRSKTDPRCFQICRLNSPHFKPQSDPNLKKYTEAHQYNSHIHKLVAEDINQNIQELNSKIPTDKYASFEEAISYSVEFFNIQNWTVSEYISKIKYVSNQTRIL
jgi:hypothetical protein